MTLVCSVLTYVMDLNTETRTFWVENQPESLSEVWMVEVACIGFRKVQWVICWMYFCTRLMWNGRPIKIGWYSAMACGGSAYLWKGSQ